MRCPPRFLLVCCFSLTLAGMLSSFANSADEEVFSGPQEGEKLADFTALGVMDNEGKPFSLIKESQGGPILLIFVHNVTRPSIGLTRQVMDDAGKRKKDGLTSGLIFLSDDMTAMQARVKRMSGAMPKGVRIGISPDKQEGPGAYGLNRNVSLTVLIGNKNKVTDNFALVQPSVQADAIKILNAVVKAVGKGTAPTLRELTLAQVRDESIRKPLNTLLDLKAQDRDVKKLIASIDEYVGDDVQKKRQLRGVVYRVGMVMEGKKYEAAVQRAVRRWGQAAARKPPPPARARQSDKLNGLLRAVIRKDASEKQVDEANAALEEHLKSNEADRQHVGRVANTIVNSGKISNYGTSHAQEIIRGWAKKYGAKQPDRRPNKR